MKEGRVTQLNPKPLEITENYFYTRFLLWWKEYNTFPEQILKAKEIYGKVTKAGEAQSQLKGEKHKWFFLIVFA